MCQANSEFCAVSSLVVSGDSFDKLQGIIAALFNLTSVAQLLGRQYCRDVGP
jgi:hypothetical protein